MFHVSILHYKKKVIKLPLFRPLIKKGVFLRKMRLKDLAIFNLKY